MSEGRKAWLVEWQSPNGKLPDNPIAAIFRPQLGGDKVKEYVDVLYAAAAYGAADKLDFMAHASENPYPARFGTFTREDGLTGPWEGQVIAGHNPYLFARIVDNLRVGDGTYRDGSPKLEWDERANPGR